MSDDKNHTDNLQSSQENQTNETRRKLAKAGIASVPVILSLASRPVWANHCTISGMMSGNLSNPHDEPCWGCTPGAWANRAKDLKDRVPPYGGVMEFSAGNCVHKKHGDNDWNGCHCKGHEYENDGTKFKDIFTGDTLFGNQTMYQIIALEGHSDAYQLGAHTVAAFFNALSFPLLGYEFGLTPTQVVDMYHAYHMTTPEDLKINFMMLNEAGDCPQPGGCN